MEERGREIRGMSYQKQGVRKQSIQTCRGQHAHLGRNVCITNPYKHVVGDTNV